MQKLIKTIIVTVAALVVAVHLAVYAVENQTLTVRGTNLVVSWPSRGYESYLVQYRHTLDDADGWVTLTNAYHANSSTRTTYVVPGVSVPAKLAGGGMPVKSAQNGLAAVSGSSALSLQSLALVSGSSVPAALYPPNLLAKLTVYDPVSGLTMSGAEFTARQAVQPVPALGGSLMTTLGGPVPGGVGVTPKTPSGNPGSAPETGFYRVFHIPDFAINMTNYVFGDPTFIPIDFADYQPRVEAVTVLVDGQPLQSEYLNYGGEWGVGIYFEWLTNGQHTIQLLSTVHLNNPLVISGEDSDYMVLSNVVRTITVFNDVSYANWIPFIQGDTYTFQMQLAVSNTDWTIYVYDTQGNYVNQGSGHTTNGAVSWTWDLTDYMGNKRTDFVNDTYFNCKIEYDDGTPTSNATTNNVPTPKVGSKSKKTKPPVQGYPDRGEWLIAYQNRWYVDVPIYGDNRDKYQNDYVNTMLFMCNGPRLATSTDPDTVNQCPIAFGTNVYTQFQRDMAWTNLMSWIAYPPVRNFYYTGHGSPTSIGADYHVLDTNGMAISGAYTPNSHAYLTSGQVAARIQYQRYRFVFLDACSTANGDWPKTFGVDKVTRTTTDDYKNDPKHPRPSVFLGWNKTVDGSTAWGTPTSLQLFRRNWMGNWANGSSPPMSIEAAILLANQVSKWIDQRLLESSLMYYGYKSMAIEEFNRKGQWQYP